MQNRDVRVAAITAGVPLWKVAEKLGIADTSLSRKLRRELSPEEKERIFGIIESLGKEADGNG